MSKNSRPFVGWLTAYKVNCPIEQHDLKAVLDPKKNIDLPPIEGGIIRANRVFMDYVDRYFIFRGHAAMGGVLCALLPLGSGGFFGFDLLNGTLRTGQPLSDDQIGMATFGLTVSILGFLAIVRFLLRWDFFCYTHYPIRFNRMTRKVYVFRYNGPSGVLEVDWEGAHWFIGLTRDGPTSIYDLRCHVVDAEGIIRHTFAVGYPSKTRAETLQHWEMIRRYMEESPAALPFPPVHLFICTEPTLWNTFGIQLGVVEAGKSSALMIFGCIWGFFRWISQKTCRTPRWPAEVEAVCQIPEDDPYRQPEPWRTGQIAGMTEEDERRDTEYTRLAKEAALAYEEANPEPAVR